MTYSLDQVREKFVQVDKMEEPKRTMELVALMDILEQQHGTLRINPTPEFMATEKVQLYREISNARVFD
ncbi:hypothetical protein DUK53_16850 [Listeria sp. SHR_NRA_18]|uniref:hypothetical protein n=1 Tax=Listeria sp. SHR_NRA_18 TaxID=2269046 RepID=UPI000F5E64AA|nr:hypothetical protein [Listeria sp. SHR_NRA_18]RQW65338.1 hypothetical protein DUK53_16850 [Listeria sp. SHR_NRA_18]